MGEEMRLQKFLSAAGIASRRAAEQLILDGEVLVNGKTAELGRKIDPDQDRVTVSGRRVRFSPDKAARVTLLMNKPTGYLCSHGDPHHGRTIYDLLPKEYEGRRFFCAGRLDLNSEGLLILTTDGDLANRIMHPASQVVKRYQVHLHKPFPKEKIPLLLRGVETEGEHLRAERAFPLGPDRGDGVSTMEVHLHHGRKREIRRLFEALGFHVKRLKRFRIGDLTVRGIPAGAVRKLGEKDLRSLELAVGGTPPSPKK